MIHISPRLNLNLSKLIVTRAGQKSFAAATALIFNTVIDYFATLKHNKSEDYTRAV